MILIGNGPLITRDEHMPFIKSGAVLIDGTFVKEVGEYENLRETYKAAEFIDAKGKVIMPGLINAHHHIYSAFARGLSIPGNHPNDFLEILEGTWWKIDRNLNLKHTFYSAIGTYMECIKNGVTSVIDHHASYQKVKGSLFQIAEAAELLGMRTCLAYEVSDRNGVDLMREAAQENSRFIEYVEDKSSTMLKAMMGMHASFTVSDQTIDYCKKLNVFEKGYHIHVAEGIYDELHCQQTYGCSVVERLYKKGILGKKSIASHCIHISGSDLDILKESGTVLVHNPESNMGNGVGCPDVLSMLDQGIVVGLGTDGFTSDMIESLKVSHIFQKHNRQNPDRGFVEANKLLFEHNASIASKIFDTRLGVLEKGASADVILVDYQPYTPMDASNFNGHVMFGMSGAMTDTTVINGKVLMRNRELLIENKELLLAKSQEAAAELWGVLR